MYVCLWGGGGGFFDISMAECVVNLLDSIHIKAKFEKLIHNMKNISLLV